MLSLSQMIGSKPWIWLHLGWNVWKWSPDSMMLKGNYEYIVTKHLRVNLEDGMKHAQVIPEFMWWERIYKILSWNIEYHCTTMTQYCMRLYSVVDNFHPAVWICWRIEVCPAEMGRSPGYWLLLPELWPLLILTGVLYCTVGVEVVTV